MKTILIIIFLSVSVFAFAQVPPMDGETGKFKYTEVVPVAGASKNDLYTRAKSWVASNYPSSANITMDDKEEGKIICKGNFPITLMGAKQTIDNTFTIEVKEGRYKYTFTDFFITSSSGSVNRWPLERKDLAMKKSIYSSVDGKVKGFIETIAETMNTEVKKEDW